MSPVTPESIEYFDDINPNIYSGARAVAREVTREHEQITAVAAVLDLTTTVESVE